MGEQLLESTAIPTEGPSYKRLTRADHTLILHLRDQNLSLEAIAQRLNRSISTIHEVVTMYTPTTDLAKRRLQAASAEMAENIIGKGRPADHIKALEGLDVLANQDTRGGLTIVVGGSAQVQINIGARQSADTPQGVVVSADLPKVSAESLGNTAGSDNARYANHESPTE